MPNCFSDNASTQNVIVKESTWGTTPADGGAIIPFVNNTLAHSREVLQSQAKYGDRMSRFSRHGNITVAGDIEVELAHGVYDLLFESLVQGEYGVGDVLNVGGNTDVTFSCEVGDTSKNIYQVYNGLTVNTLELRVQLGQLVTTRFGCIGKGIVESTSTFDATPTAAPDKQPMVEADGTVLIDGTNPGIITDITLNVDNQITPNMALGSNEAVCLSTQQVNVSGTLTVFLKDLAFINKFRNETTSSISIQTNDGNGNTYTFLVPKAKWNSADTPASGNDTRTVTMDFEGLFDSATGTNFRITRS